MIKENGQFKKGIRPWNKDTKGIMKPNKTTFIKGQVAHNKGEKSPWVKNNPQIFKKGHKAPKTAFQKGNISPWTGKKRPDVSGKKHWNYKGGITPENHKIRTSLEIKLWKKSVYERDNFTCQKYGTSISGSLIVHHINNFADFIELRTSIENGITLSKKAHEEFHSKYGNKNNSREQLEEFLNK